MTSKDIKPVIEQPATEIPLMLAQVIIVAGVLAIGEIACSPLYFTLMDHSLALVPWALEAAFLAVAFTFVVGFALLWCAESFTFKLKERFRPFGYAAVGLIGYGVWSLLVFTATIADGRAHAPRGIVLTEAKVKRDRFRAAPQNGRRRKAFSPFKGFHSVERKRKRNFLPMGEVRPSEDDYNF